MFAFNEVNNRVSQCLSSSWVDGVTNNYSVPKIHPQSGYYALPVEDFASDCFTVEEKNNSVILDSTWNVTPRPF